MKRIAIEIFDELEKPLNNCTVTIKYSNYEDVAMLYDNNYFTKKLYDDVVKEIVLYHEDYGDTIINDIGDYMKIYLKKGE